MAQNITFTVAPHSLVLGRASSLGVISFLIITSNIACLFALRKTDIVYRQTKAFLTSLIVADGCIGLIMLIPTVVSIAMGYWPFGDTACVTYSLFTVIGVYAEQFSFLCVTFDRFVSIKKPLAYHRIVTINRTRATVVCAWTLAFLIGIFAGQHANWVAEYSPPHGACHFDKYHSTDSLPSVEFMLCWIFLFPAPIVFIGILNLTIYVIARRHARRVEHSVQHLHRLRQMSVKTNSLTLTRELNQCSEGTSNETNPPPVCRLELKVTMTMLIISAFYLLAWIPALIVNGLDNLTTYQVSYAKYFVQDVLFYSNSFINTLIFFWRFRSFRKAVTDVFRRWTWATSGSWCLNLKY